MSIKWPETRKCDCDNNPRDLTCHGCTDCTSWNASLEACKAAVAEAKGEEVNIKDATRFDKGMEKLREYTDKKYGDVKHECDTIDKSNGEELVPSHLEPPDYETPLNRAFLENKISEWYDKKFAHETKRFKTVSVFDLIADFIMDTGFGHPKPRKVPNRDRIMIEIYSYRRGGNIQSFNLKYVLDNDHDMYIECLEIATIIHSLLEEGK